MIHALGVNLSVKTFPLWHLNVASVMRYWWGFDIWAKLRASQHLPLAADHQSHISSVCVHTVLYFIVCVFICENTLDSMQPCSYTLWPPEGVNTYSKYWESIIPEWWILHWKPLLFQIVFPLFQHLFHYNIWIYVIMCMMIQVGSGFLSSICYFFRKFDYWQGRLYSPVAHSSKMISTVHRGQGRLMCW